MGKTFYEAKPKKEKRICNSVSIKTCVEEALEKGDHQAFVEFFFSEKKTRFTKKMFNIEYKKLLGEEGKKDILENCKILHSEYWRNEKFDRNNKNYIALSDKRYKKWKIIIDKRFSDVIRPCGIKIEKWKKENRKSIDEILATSNLKRIIIRKRACCLWIRKKVFQSDATKRSWWDGNGAPGKDELVQLGLYLGWGYETIDSLLMLLGKRQLYPVDIVDAIGIYYLELFKHNKDIEPQNKIDIVKREINNRGEMLGMKKINVSTMPLDYDLKQEIEELKREFNIAKATGNTLYITDYVKKELKTAIVKKDFDSFFDNVKEIASIKQYEFIRRTLEYIDDVNSYKKNLYYHEFDFSANLSKNEIEKIINNGYEYMLYDFDDNSDLWDKDYKLRVLNGICKIKNYNNIEQQKLPKDKVFSIKNMIEGRSKNLTKHIRHKEDDPYVLKNDNILVLMKFIMAAGKEDKMGEYLIRSGHRQINLNEMIEYIEDTNRIWDKTDSLFIYCLCYRDELIKKWEEKFAEETSRISMRNKVKEKFPMLQLLMSVNKEIQEHKEYKDTYIRRDYYNNQVSLLLFPVEKDDEKGEK